MGTRAPSVDGPNGGGAVRVRVKGSDDDDDGIGMAMLCTAAPESDGRAPVSDTVELGAPGRDAKGKSMHRESMHAFGCASGQLRSEGRLKGGLLGGCKTGDLRRYLIP